MIAGGDCNQEPLGQKGKSLSSRKEAIVTEQIPEKILDGKDRLLSVLGEGAQPGLLICGTMKAFFAFLLTSAC